jgi:hypothetical protein
MTKNESADGMGLPLVGVVAVLVHAWVEPCKNEGTNLEALNQYQRGNLTVR